MSRSQRLPRDARVLITALGDDGWGAGQAQGMTLRVAGALPGEQVSVRVLRKRGRRLAAAAEIIETPHAQRVSSPCAAAASCGGCALQHLHADAQVQHKRAHLAGLFDAVGVQAQHWLPDLRGPLQGYRHKARLGVRDVPERGVMVGFRERGSARVADVERCRILAPRIGEQLSALRQLLATLDARARVPQLEIAVGEDAAAVVVRHLDPLSAADLQRLRDGCAALQLHLYLQPGGPETVTRAWPPSSDSSPADERLHYLLADFGLRMAFHPLDFTQVNPVLNTAMVSLAVDLLDAQPHERVLDLFCGLGNFTLPLAQRAAEVLGVEGSADLVARAEENAAANGITNARFTALDLYADEVDVAALGPVDGLLLDPPRSGAEQIVRQVQRLQPRRIVYVACGPAALARDAALLVEGGYRCTTLGIMDMFPHTAHYESIAVFEPATARGSDGASDGAAERSTELSTALPAARLEGD